MTVQATWKGASEAVAWLRDLARTAPERVGVAGVGAAAITVQRDMRQWLQAMVYDQPRAASGYARTKTLMKSTHASPPDTNHDGDEARARAGEDLATNTPSRAAGLRGSQVISEIGPHTEYAQHVVDGVNQPSERPFVDQAADDAEDTLTAAMEAAILKAMGEK